jgi:hypothetical protein
MPGIRRKSNFVLGASLALGLGLVGPSQAQSGGVVEKTKHYRFEVVLAPDGLKVYPHGGQDQPLDTSRMSATATFYHPATPKPWFSRPLRPGAAAPGQAPASLDASINLSKVPTRGTRVVFAIAGLPDPAEPTASFTVPFTFTRLPEAAARPAPATITFAKATRADQAAINAQRVCKVSGEALGSMGVPIKVSRGGRATYLCCQGCLKAIQANPDKYLAATTGKG